MKHPQFADTNAATNLADAIDSLRQQVDYWRAEAVHWQKLAELHMDATRQSIASHEESFGNMLVAALDPDSGINRMVRAIDRDPLKGAVS